MVVVHVFHERLDFRLLLNLVLAHRSCHFARVPIDTGNYADTNKPIFVLGENMDIPIANPYFLSPTPSSNAFTTMALRPAKRPFSNTTTFPFLMLS